MSALQAEVDLRDEIQAARAEGDDLKAAELALQYAWARLKDCINDVDYWRDLPPLRQNPRRLREAQERLTDAEETRKRAHERWLSCPRKEWTKEAKQAGLFSQGAGRPQEPTWSK